MNPTQMVDRITHEVEELVARARREVEDKAETAQRMLRQARRRVDDIGDEAVHKVKHHPVAALAIAFSAGAALALILSSLGRNRNL